MIDRTVDWHTHSSLTDGADSPQEMASAAAVSGLHAWGLSDHVRADSTWVQDYVKQVRSLDAGPVRVLCGVEAKILDSRGRLDLPVGLSGLDYVLVADHQFPGGAGPIHPREVKAALDAGTWTAAGVTEQLVEAIVRAAASSPYPAIIAHLFSLLPKCGLVEDDIADDVLRHLAQSLAQSDARVEANEKWRCPSSRVLDALALAQVELTAGSDAHRREDIGHWQYVDELLVDVAAR